MPDKKRLGHFICKILRHNPEAINAVLEKDGGWISVETLLSGLRAKGYDVDRDLLDQIVAEDDKQRYEYDETRTRIRAKRGHSVHVELHMDEEIPPDVLYHGTAISTKDAILREGIKPMNRLYVHLSPTIEYATSVGKRHGLPCVFRIDVAKMKQDGYKFYRPDGVVWLTKYVPAKYLMPENINQ